ncbi:hypothetical protein B0J11DRAFT_287623 [Dendryphion nanum]|uniref:Bromodomain and PHD finger-containing protein n=1 Tax=Dendryphion nanum TaxID=256645 RepID=A0A9P9IPS9_9PLEO|nr:hypothetical protein B0J11DRAFT_287623 [Dendryphion nanum]
MAPIPGTPNPRVRSTGRLPRRTVSDSAPPLKKRRYIPGGPGGGGRYVDEDGEETPVGGTGPGGYAYTGPRGRVGRINAERQGITLSSTSPTQTYSRPRRERPPAGPRSSSAAAVAAAVAQSDGYKPREERGWEEFHPDLDIETDFVVFSADLVDGISPVVSTPTTPQNGFSSQYAIESGASAILDEALRRQVVHDDDLPNGRFNGFMSPSMKRRVGRPPRKADHSHMLNGLGSPPAPRILPLPTHNPKEKLNLPKPSVRRIDPFKAFEEAEGVKVNYVDRTMASIGYQESEVFNLPEKSLIRVPEGSIEEDLDLTIKTDGDGVSNAVAIGKVEYDMDEQDDRWLEQLNAQRKEEGMEIIKPAIFEVTLTQIEKEWHGLEKRIPKPNPKPPQTHRPRSSSAAAVNGEPAGQGEEQDTKCAICDDGDCENTNAIVFCDGCDLAVHQECYGVPFIPEGQWLCRRCQLVGRGTPISDQPGCIFCPNLDGAFKQTTNMKWSHLLCAMWIPEVSLGNTTFQEPVQDVEKVPKTRWKLTCYICKQKMGACIQCGHKSCFDAFHVTCARRARLCLKMKSSQASNPQDAVVLKAYCDRHSPNDWRRENDVEEAVMDAKDFYRRNFRHIRWGDSQAQALSIGSSHPIASIEDLDDSNETNGQKRKRGQNTRSWRLPSGAPVVPQAVYHNVENTLIRFSIRKRKEFVQEACKYWTLKREARRGAALLKRLQLQMEAFSSMEVTRRNFTAMGAIGRPRLQRRIEFAERLEDDMEQMRVLCQHVKEREATKLKDVYILKSILDSVYFPLPKLLQPILDRAQALDSKGNFTEGFNEIQAKLDEQEYTSVQTFGEDIAAVLGSVVGFAATTNAGDADHQLRGVAHNSLTPEQKEKKKQANRIMKAIQPRLKDTLHNESDLAGRSYERELPDLDALVEQMFRRPQALPAETAAPTYGSANGEDHDDVAEEDGIEDENAQIMVNGDGKAKDNHTTSLALTPDDDSADHHMHVQDDAADEAAIAAQLGQDALHMSASDNVPLDAMAIDHDGGDDSTAGAPPLTPPRSERDLLAPFAHGGIPWYMEPFSPRGTTIYEEKWSGRDVLRDMSEELSELDDDELDDLAGSEHMHPTDDITPGTLVSDAQQKSVRKPKRRIRSYR